MNLTFLKFKWMGVNAGSYIRHKVSSIELSTDNEHNIPNGFLLHCRCGVSSSESIIDLEPVEPNDKPIIDCDH